MKHVANTEDHTQTHTHTTIRQQKTKRELQGTGAREERTDTEFIGLTEGKSEGFITIKRNPHYLKQ